MKSIPNYPNYSVTEDGKVINNKTNKELKPILGNTGYCQVSLCNNGKIKNYNIHRLIASAFLSNDENKREVNHINGIKTDNRLKNLEWNTSSENRQHAFNTGLKKYTEIQRARVSESLSKPVLDTQTGIFYNSAKEASRLLGINKNTLYGYLLGHNPNKTSLIYA
jgi:hypothetical protein